jgi:hypothetical protein
MAAATWTPRQARLTIAAAAAALVALVPAGDATARSGIRVFTGRLDAHHVDRFAQQRSSTRYALVRRGHRIRLILARPPRLPSGTAVVVRGRRIGTRLKGSLRPARPRLRAAAVEPRARRVAVILVRWSDDAHVPFTIATARQRVFTDPDSVNAFYKEDSYGDVSLTGKLRADGDVFGWYTVDPTLMDPVTYCQADPFSEAANQAAAADGFDASVYDHIVYVMQRQDGCNFMGVADIPGKRSWINGNLELHLIAHELGHNMGLHHANALWCTTDGQPVAIGPDCTNQESGDPFDVMGSQMRRNNGWHLRQIGFMPKANERTVSASGTYSLRATRTRGGTQLLRIPRAAGATPRYYDVELHTSGGPFDFDPATSAAPGVMIHTDPEPSEITQSLLLDATPGSPDGMRDAALPPGQTFSDGSISISLESVIDDVARVHVETVPDTTPPSVPRSLTAVPATDRVTLEWEQASDDVEVVGYRVLRDGAVIGTTAGTTWTDTAVTRGTTYSYRVQAFDQAGNTRGSAAVTAAIPPVEKPKPPPDTTRPVVTITAPARDARLRRRSAVVRARATDAVGVVRIEVWIDGKLRRSAGRAKVAWSWSLRHARLGRHKVTVKAYDAARNMGKASTSIRVIR